MKIAIISALYHATPPTGYGGIERVVSLLTEEIIRQGHDVLLFGAKGSYCSGKTIALDSYDPARLPSGIRKKSDIISEEKLYEAMVKYFKKNSVDIIHDFSFQNLFVLRHPDRLPFLISTCIPPGQGYQRPNLVACSQAHAKLCGGSTRYVYYGLNLKDWPYNFNKEAHFIHISKITKYKGQHLAIEAAKSTKVPLQIAGNVEDPLYYYTKILPSVVLAKNIRLIGEVDGTIPTLLKAKALIQTPLWFDCFPLVILESFACGTPVIAFGEGGIPEQIVHGKTGFICKNLDDMKQAMLDINRIQPEVCREYAEQHFTVKRMATDYLDLYQAVRRGDNW